jgi:hypothetical protein
MILNRDPGPQGEGGDEIGMAPWWTPSTGRTDIDRRRAPRLVTELRVERECRRIRPMHQTPATSWTWVIFDDENLMSFEGLVPAMALAERAGLSELIGAAGQVQDITSPLRGRHPVRKRDPRWSRGWRPPLTASTIWIRSGGRPRVFGGVSAPATLGQFLRELRRVAARR